MVYIEEGQTIQWPSEKERAKKIHNLGLENNHAFLQNKN
jgi:hypothetical protein